MMLVVQICMVVVTIALVALAVLAMRLVFQTRVLIKTTNRALVELPALIAEARRTSARADGLLHAFSRITGSVEVAASQFEGLAKRSSAMTNTLLDEVERPVLHVAGMIHGIQAGASHLVQRWRWRAGRCSNTNEGESHAGEQKWLDDGGSSAGSGDRGRAGSDVRANGR